MGGFQLSGEVIAAAHRRIAPHIHRTPVLTSARLDAMVGARLFFKCENFQKSGAFKARGAYNAVLSLDETVAAAGVVTHSSGNHGAALALAARTRGITARIVLPRGASRAKMQALEAYGAEIVLCEPTLAARERAAAAIAEASGAHFVHPYDDDDVIAGQASVAVELFEQAPGLDVVTCPIGGGGLMAGTTLAARAFAPGVRVIAAEPAGADDARRSFESGVLTPQTSPDTLADGLRASLGGRAFAVMMGGVEDVLTTSDAAIIEAMKLVWEAMKIIIEPSSAVPLAALLERRPLIAGQRVGVILTGGNVDLDHLPWAR